MQNTNRSEELTKLTKQLYSQTPLIGWKLRRDAVDALVQDGSSEAIDALIEAISRSTDAKVQEIALNALLNMASLENRPAREALCRLVLEHDHPIARKAVLAAPYVPNDPYQRAAFYYLTEQWDKYEDLDFDQNMLKAVYKTAKPDIRRRLAEMARRAGRTEWTRIAIWEHQEKRSGGMSDEEWTSTLAVLNEKESWAEIWHLAQTAPAIWSMRLLLRLKEVNWMPAQKVEQEALTQLTHLAEECRRVENDTTCSVVYCHARLKGHTGGLTCLSIGPEGWVLASGGWDEVVRLWSLSEKAALCALTGHTGGLTSLAISSDGQILASGSWDQTVRLWRFPEGTALHALQGHTAAVRCLAISPDARILASGGRDGKVRLWRLADGTALRTLTGHTEPVRCVAISPDGRTLASGSYDNTIRLWRLPDGMALHTLEGHTDWVQCVALSPDGRLLASGSMDTTVRLWTLPGGTALHTLQGHTDGLTCLAISPDGRILASGGYDRTVRLWNLPDGRSMQTLHGHTDCIWSLTISPDGKVLASGGREGNVRLWPLEWADFRRLIVGQTGLEDLRLIQTMLYDKQKLSDADQKWLNFLLALVHWQRRYDIEIGETSLGIPIGAFDIEIDQNLSA